MLTNKNENLTVVDGKWYMTKKSDQDTVINPSLYSIDHDRGV